MQVNNINVTNSNSTVTGFIKTKDKTNFNGILRPIGDYNKGFISFLEKGGFCAEFCLMDMVGLVAPRVYQGFKRNKKELGHPNYQAGIEEFLREFITGPSMFLIPVMSVFLAGRLMGKATQINTDLIDKFSGILKNVSNNLANSDLKTTNRAFASSLFDELFTNNKERLVNTHQKLADFKEKFVTQLTDSVGKKLKRGVLKDKENQFCELVSDINVAFFKKENTYATKLAHSSDIFDSARKYMEDVIHSAKLSVTELQQKGLDTSKKSIHEVIQKVTAVRKNGRELLCVAGTLALAGFLSIIPKIYQLSKKNPALSGLEECNEGGKKC